MSRIQTLLEAVVRASMESVALIPGDGDNQRRKAGVGVPRGPGQPVEERFKKARAATRSGMSKPSVNQP
jgi:hypothetical protein